MTRIKKLEKSQIAKIAAGEVVERPANVVKELVENSLDAEADKIRIEIDNGGLDGLRIKDNGYGIPSDDLLKAFELHTTSKLEGDISQVPTLGFRGEALASIASVSRLMCKSRYKHESKGKKIVLEGGNLKSEETVKIPSGTIIEVSGLFYNTPARRKFMKTPRTERKRITELVTTYSLMYPEVHFVLIENLVSGSTINRIDCPSRNDMISTIYDVLGPEIAEGLLEVDDIIGEWQISGFISNPQLNRSDRSLQFISINGRPIRDPELQGAIEDAYGSQMMRKVHPVLILKFKGPVDGIDFNVHPQKSEVRFRSDDPIFEKITDVVLQTLEENTSLPELSSKKLDRIKSQESLNIIQENNSVNQMTDVSKSTTQQKLIDQQYEIQDSEKKEKSSKPQTIQSTLTESTPIESSKGYIVHGHIMDKFGVIEQNDELWLVDIHAADERVKFEMYEKGLEREIMSQQLLDSQEISLPEMEKQYLLDNEKLLSQYGLKISNGGKNCLFIHAVPVYFDHDVTPQSIANLLSDIVGYLNETKTTDSSVSSPFDRIEYAIVSRLACHGAIRSGYKISNQDIKSVVNNLLKCTYPWTCAHGRPTVLRLTRSNIENWFKR